MTNCPVLFENLNDLRNFITETLCEREQLEIGAFPLTEQVLRQRKQPIGMYFCLHGPRSVKFSAVWDALRNIVLFYGANGERYLTTRLLQPPQSVFA